MYSRRLGVFITAFAGLAAAGPAAAQASAAALVRGQEPRAQMAPSERTLRFIAPDGDLRLPGEPRRSGLIAAFPVRENVEIGIGRFAVPEIARPRTNLETERNPSSVRLRDRGIAAIGVSFRF